jgi:hypothetical protein
MAIETIKFSQMTSGGDLANNDMTPGLQSGENVLFNNPWTFLAPGSTAQRPAPSTAINYRLRLNTDTQIYEYYNPLLAAWVQLAEGSTTAGPFITYTADAGLPEAQNLGLLANGILKQTISSGTATLNIAVQGTDYYGPGDTPTFAGMTLSGNLNMGGFTATNAANPVNPQDYATKFYVDQTALNGTSVYAASAATLGTVTQSGAGVGATLTNAGTQATLALDGVNPPVGSNVLIKNTATGMTSANEGIYTVTSVGSASSNWILTRATSYDNVTEINNTGLIAVQNGSTLAGTAWYNVSTIVTVDTTPFNYLEFGNIVFPITLAHGGTNANLTASNGGIVYSGASSLAILAGTATANQLLLSGASTTPAWSTSTYPATNAINTLLYASSANVMAALATANSSVLVTDVTGIPGWSTTLPADLLMTTPWISGGLKDVNGNNMLGWNQATSAVNYIAIQNAGSGNNPSFAVVGSDTNISLNLFSKGTGGINVQGFSDGSNAAAGIVREFLYSNVPSGSAITLVANTTTNVTSLSLTPGDWDVYGNLDFQPTGIIETLNGFISTTSATGGDPSVGCRFLTAAAANGVGFALPMLRVSTASTMNVYLVASSSSTPKVSGTLQARRR